MPGRRVFRILAVKGSNSPGLLIRVKDDTAVANLAVTVVRLNI